VLPESYPKEKRKRLQFNKINPFNSLVRIFTKPNILALSCVHFLLQMAGQTHPSIWTLYSKFRYGWSNAQIGLSLATVGLLSAFSQGWLTRIFIPRFGENKIVLFSSFGFVISYSAFGLANEGWMIYLILFLSCVLWTSQPALQSLITEKIPAHEQGELQGSLISLTSLASIINPIVSTQLFASFTRVELKHIVPGIPYFFAAFMSSLAFCVLLSLNIKIQRKKYIS
jgi:DHA1 family tetracycline resistance protein-like MFS transporter